MWSWFGRNSGSITGVYQALLIVGLVAGAGVALVRCASDDRTDVTTRSSAPDTVGRSGDTTAGAAPGSSTANAAANAEPTTTAVAAAPVATAPVTTAPVTTGLVTTGAVTSSVTATSAVPGGLAAPRPAARTEPAECQAPGASAVTPNPLSVGDVAPLPALTGQDDRLIDLASEYASAERGLIIGFYEPQRTDTTSEGVMLAPSLIDRLRRASTEGWSVALISIGFQDERTGFSTARRDAEASSIELPLHVLADASRTAGAGYGVQSRGLFPNNREFCHDQPWLFVIDKAKWSSPGVSCALRLPIDRGEPDLGAVEQCLSS